jgi:hypothetical protein
MLSSTKLSLPNGGKRRYEIRDKRYLNFINSLKAEVTRADYARNLNYYLQQNDMTLDELFSLSVSDAEQLLIDYIERLKQSKKSFSRINSLFCTIKHLYIMNDIRINERKIGKFLGERTVKNRDRAYTYEEIKKLLDAADSRPKLKL